MLLGLCLLTSLFLGLQFGDPGLLLLGSFLFGLLLVVVFVAALRLATLATSSCGEEGVDVDDVLQETPLNTGARSQLTQNLVLVGGIQHLESRHLGGLCCLESQLVLNLDFGSNLNKGGGLSLNLECRHQSIQDE
jgi:hypothetical protein